jgi:putative nucleotidyltransferase with HDIG domain
MPRARTQIRLGEGYAGRAARERTTLCCADLRKAGEADPRARRLAAEGFVCAYSVPLVAKGEVKGILEVYHRQALTPNQEWLEFLSSLAGQAAIAVENAELFDQLQRSNSELALAYESTLEGWSKALDLRDRETEGHTLRTADLTVRLAHAVGVSPADLVQVRRGALLHDIGKMGVPDSVLLKPGPLTPEEWEVMRRHPVYAYEMLSPITYLRQALEIPYGHHEKWDGTGYPRGLKAEQIPLGARIFAVVDVWDALCTDRPYRLAWPADKARQHIQDQAGKHFDSQVVRAFLSLLDVEAQARETNGPIDQ